jgi:hypothetical protein
MTLGLDGSASVCAISFSLTFLTVLTLVATWGVLAQNLLIHQWGQTPTSIRECFLIKINLKQELGKRNFGQLG